PRYLCADSVLEEVVGVQLLVAGVVVGGPLEMLGPALGDDVDDTGSALSVLSLIVVEEHLHLGDGVHGNRRIQAGAAPHVARDAVHVRTAVDSPHAGDG